MTDRTENRSSFADVSPAVWVVAALGVAVVASPLQAGALAATVAGLLGAIALLLAPGAASRGVPRAALLPLALLTALAAWLAFAASRATVPGVSLFGMTGQHDGALLWIAAAGLAWAAAVSAGPRDLRHVTIAVALLGVVFSAGAALDALGLLGEAGRFSQEASGFLESSVTLGQVLVIALGCAAAWALSARSAERKLLAWVAAGAITAGLAVSQSRAAWVAAAAAAACAAVVHRAEPRWRRAIAVGLAVAALASVAALPALLGAGKDGHAPSWLDTLTNDRTVIWESALADARGRLLAGRGPDRFSAWQTWDAPEPTAVEAIGAYDPHDLLLYLLVSGGVIALLLGVAALASFLDALWAGSAARGGPAASAVVAGLIGWALTLRAAWIAPLSASLAALVAGVALGAMARDEERVRSAWLRRTRVVAAVSLAAAALAFARPTLVELRWAAEDHERTASASTLEADFAAWPDPAYARSAMEKRLAGDTETDLVAARRTVEALDGQLDLHVDCALTAARVRQASDVASGEKDMTRFLALIDRGKRADPTSGLWDYVAALESARRDDARDLTARARAALAFPQPARARAWLTERLSESETATAAP